MNLLAWLQSELDRGRLEWRRMRYAEAATAARALDLVRQAGYALELRLRREGGLAKLYLGAPRKTFGALERMAPAFGIMFAPAAEPPRPLSGTLMPGTLAQAGAAEADARIAGGGMCVRGVAGLARQGAAAPVELPAPDFGLQSVPALPFEPRSRAEAVWLAGEGGLSAPAGLVGGDLSRRSVLLPLATRAVTNCAPTIILDGGDGQLAYALSQQPEVTPLLQSGRLLEMNLARAGQLGFNPLAECANVDDTSARWRWFWRGTGADPEHLQAAYQAGLRSLAELRDFFESDPRWGVSAHAVRALTEAEQGVLGVWMSGNFDVAGHLRAGGHLLVGCPMDSGPRLRALRGLIGLAMESEARLLSVGVRWPDLDDAALTWMNAICDGRRWTTTAYTRCAPELAARVAAWHTEPSLSEYLSILPDGVALVNEPDENQEASWKVLKV